MAWNPTRRMTSEQTGRFSENERLSVSRKALMALHVPDLPTNPQADREAHDKGASTERDDESTRGVIQLVARQLTRLHVQLFPFHCHFHFNFSICGGIHSRHPRRQENARSLSLLCS